MRCNSPRRWRHLWSPGGTTSSPPPRSAKCISCRVTRPKSRATPFQPPLEANQTIRWLTPALFPSTSDSPDTQLVISDGTKLYLLSQVAEPTPHLEATTALPVDPADPATGLTSPLAVAGNVVAAGTSTGAVALFELPALTPRATTDVGGQLAWGPFAAGESFVCSTDGGELLCLGPDGAILWRTPLGDRRPTGKPLIDTAAASLTLAWQLHGVSRLSLADGSELAQASLDQALVGGPIPLGRRLVLTAADGTLLIVNQP